MSRARSGLGRTFLLGWLGTVALVAAGCGGSTAPSATPSPAASTHRPTKAADTTPITFVAPHTGDKYIYLTKQRRNRKVYVLRADAEKGEYFGTNTGRSSFVNPHITFFGSGAKEVVADAPAGLVIESEKSVFMSGGVHARSQDGVTLTSDTMRYDDASQTIHAEGDVVMNSPQGSELRGSTLDWNLTSGAVNVAGAH
jgi:LPS export ABC transporter protein LptC